MDELKLELAEVDGMPDFRDVILNRDKVGYFVYIPDAGQWLFSLYGHPAFLGLLFCQAVLELHKQLEGIKPDSGKLH